MALAVDSLRRWSAANPGREKDLMKAWADDPAVGEPEVSGTPPHPRFDTVQERLHGLNSPIHFYPMMENALRHKYGKSFEEHHASVSALMSSFSRVAASQPDHAWLPIYRTSEEIAIPSASNRWVGYPYTKYMNANDNVDGAASWLLCSVSTARRLGVHEDKWVYLHAGAECHEGADDKWFVSGRSDLSRLPGMERAIMHCLSSAGVNASQVDHFDLYSCFPCVVEMAADVMNLPHDYPRGFTITGGLPFYGQMSSTCCIPAMVEKLRVDRSAVGLVTGNGGYASKHSAGLYSASPPQRPFMLPALDRLQAEVNAMPSAKFTDSPQAEAMVETFTVQHNKDNRPSRGVIFVRLRASGERFIAIVDDDPSVYALMMQEDIIGRQGRVVAGEKGQPNRFRFN